MSILLKKKFFFSDTSKKENTSTNAITAIKANIALPSSSTSNVSAPPLPPRPNSLQHIEDYTYATVQYKT